MGLNQKEAIKFAPKDLQPFLEGVVRNHKFKKFEAINPQPPVTNAVVIIIYLWQNF